MTTSPPASSTSQARVRRLRPVPVLGNVWGPSLSAYVAVPVKRKCKTVCWQSFWLVRAFSSRIGRPGLVALPCDGTWIDPEKRGRDRRLAEQPSGGCG